MASAPEPWQGWHCIAAMRQRGYLMGSLWFKLWRAARGRRRQRRGHRQAALRRRRGRPAVHSARRRRQPVDREPGGPSRADPRAEPAGRQRRHRRREQQLGAGAEPDRHRQADTRRRPASRLRAAGHVRADASAAAMSSTRSASPFPACRPSRISRHNAHVAWCVTHAFADIHDLYVEQFDRADPSRYRHRGDWLQAATTTEQIKVRGGAPAPVQIVTTIHGPVVAGDPARGAALTLKSVQFFDLDRSFDCLLPMLRAGSVDSLFQAVRGWGLIDHNLVAADTGGHIGHLVRAVIPRRPAVNGWLPVPGWTGEYEWDGMIPAEQMPRVDDPARGYLVTANNRVVDRHPGDRRLLLHRRASRPTGPGESSSSSPSSGPRRRRTWRRFIATTSARPPSCSRRRWPTSRRRAPLPVPSGTSCSAGMRRMSPDSAGAACYSRLRWALAGIVGSRSGLAAARTRR